MTVLIDSNIWIEYFSGSSVGKKALPFIEGNEKIVMSTINLAEIFRHIMARRGKQDAERAKDALLKYGFSIPVTNTIAIEAAVIKHEKKMGLADAIIYATAKQENAQIVTIDNDFRGCENVLFLS